MKRVITNIIFLVVATVAICAQQVSFTTSVPHRVKQGDKFAVTFRLKNAQGSGLKAPNIDGCTYIYGPSLSTSQSTQIINGQMSSSMSSDYTFYYRADRAGECTVGEATIEANGKTLRTQKVTFTVIPSSDASSNSQQGNRSNPHSQVDIYDADTQQSDRAVSSNDIFVRIILSKSSVYEQEAVECEIKLYTKYGISAFIPTRQPAFDNFLIEEINVSNQINIEETYNGQRYMTALLKKCILYPQKSGKLTINSGNYDVTVIQYDRINMGLFSVQQPHEKQIKIQSNTGSLNVLPFPEPIPAGFQGAVGNFTAESHLVGTNFKSGDPASLILTINGTGNIKYLHEPEVNFPSQFEVYTPTSHVNGTVTGSNITGTMTIDYTFVPTTSGDFEIPAMPFVYFNPATKEYKTIDLPSYQMKVQKGTSRISTSGEQTEIDAQVRDIRFIHNNGAVTLSSDHSYTIYKFGFWTIPIVALLLLITVILLKRRQIKMNSDITNMRLAKANKIARKRLNEAQKAMSAGNASLFYDETLKALWGYFSDKLSIPVSQLSRANISEELQRNKYSADIASQAIDLIDQCETAKYAPTGGNDALEQTYKECCSLIDKIERSK